MNIRNARVITVRFVCHLVLACTVLIIQLPAQTPDAGATTTQRSGSVQSPAPNWPFPLTAEKTTEVTISSKGTQEKDGNIYKLHEAVEIDFRDYTLRADDITYNQDTGDAVAIGHVTLDGGTNDEHIEASRAEYNIRTQQGKFENVLAKSGVGIGARNATLTTTEPFTFTGKSVEKTGAQKYVVHHGSVTSCALPKPKWTLDAERIDVDLSDSARIYNTTFRIDGVPVLYLPYATHPTTNLGRHTGFLVPTFGQSSRKGTIIGDSIYFAINRSVDATAGAEYFSTRGWSQHGELRARPSQYSDINFDYFGVVDRGIGSPKVDQGGQDIKLDAETLIPHDIRGVADINYLSSFVFRLAFTESFNQAVNSEVKSQTFVSKNFDGYSLNAYAARYQNFQSATTGDLITIFHVPSFDFASVDREFTGTPFYWSVNGQIGGATRSQPTVETDGIVGRYDVNPRTSVPLFFRGWTFRPELGLRDTYYSERQTGVNGSILDDGLNRRAIEGDFEMRPPTLERIFDKPVFGEKLKHTVEPRMIYRVVDGVSGFQNVIRFDARDILSDTNEVEYAVIQRLFVKPVNKDCSKKEFDQNGVEKPCSDASRELLSWELAQRYYFDPDFGGAIINGKRNVLTTSLDFAGISFLTEPRRFSPIVSKVRLSASEHIEGSWELDYDTVNSRINASTLFVDYKFGQVFFGGSQAFLRAPGEILVSNPTPGPDRFNQFRFLGGYGGPNKVGWSTAVGIGFDSNFNFLQYGSLQATHNWDCCGVSAEYRRYALGNVRNENQFRFAFSLANVGLFGNMKRQERLY
jgi:LPS-assembly protein